MNISLPKKYCCTNFGFCVIVDSWFKNSEQQKNKGGRYETTTLI